MFCYEVEEIDAGFTIDAEASHVIGVIRDDQPDEMTWTIHIEWNNPDMDEPSFGDAHIDIVDVSFGPGDCRRLKGREAHVVYDTKEGQPILPDHAANFYYCGEHHTPNGNQLRIVKCNGPDLEIHWTCQVENMGYVVGPLEIRETVEFRKIIVLFTTKKPGLKEKAWALVERHIDRAQLGEPKVQDSQVEFPVNMPRAAPAKQKAKPKDPIEAALKEFGIKIERDKSQTGKPIFAVTFTRDGGDEAVAQLKALPNLRRAEITGSRITNDGLAALDDLVHLVYLDITGGSPIGDAGLVHLRKMKMLNRLFIDNCEPATDAGLEVLCTLSSISELYLVGGQFTDVGAAHLKKLPTVYMLSLAGSKINDAAPTHLQGLKNLRNLNINRTCITDAGLKAFKPMKALEYLDMASTNLTDAALRILDQGPPLKRLDVSGTNITDAGLAHLQHLSSLTLLYLKDTQVTQQGIEALRKRFPSLNVMTV